MPPSLANALRIGLFGQCANVCDGKVTVAKTFSLRGGRCYSTYLLALAMFEC